MTEAVADSFQPLSLRPVLPLALAKRRSPLRSLATFTLLVVLTTIIIVYLHVTDPTRVRLFAQKYIANMTGGSVTIGRASLSIFEGLRLDNLRISTMEGGHPTPLLDAKSFQVHFDLRALLAGHFAAEQVLALEPHVYFVEDVDHNQWSFQRLERPPAKPGPSGPPVKTGGVMFSEMLVRNARIDYAQIINGVRSEVGTLNFEGQIAPGDQNLYRFRMQSRGGDSATFPIAEGWLKPDGSQVGLVVRDVAFVDEIKTILPAVVRRFWEEHHLAGRMSQTRVNYFRKPDGKAGFKVETVLDNVKMTLPPTAWMGVQESDRIRRWQSACRIMSSPALGGSAVANSIGNAMTPSGLQFDQVDGTFVFTDEKITIDEVVARFENNRFKVTGDIGGYDTGAAMNVRVESLKKQNIFIPESPAYIASMPWPVQQIYYRFHPQGGCAFWFHARRAAGQHKPVLDGEIAIKDASFIFDRVPYPLQHGYGTIRLGTDAATGEQTLELASIRVRGIDGGANENASLQITGNISPLDERAGFDIRIAGHNLKSEPRMIQSLPPLTRAAVEGLDPQHTGKLPAFDCDFVSDVSSAIGVRKPVIATTTLNVTHASGAIKDFPYPLRDASAVMTVYDDHLDLTSLKTKHGNAALALSGTINWQRRDPATHALIVQPDLHIVATDVPIDADLLAALPEQKRNWLRSVGLGGKLDVDGTITGPTVTTDQTALDLAVTLRQGTMHPKGTTVPLTDVHAAGRMTAVGMTLTALAGKFENAAVQGTGTVRWDKDAPSATAAVRATNVAIDDALLAVLPDATRRKVAAFQAKGVIDADLDYAAAETTDYRLALHPRYIDFTPDFFPVAMKNVHGDIIIEPQRVRLIDITATRDKAVLVASGTIDRTSGQARLSLAGRDWQLDDAVRHALPAGVHDFVDSIRLTGGIAFDCPALQMYLAPDAPGPATRAASTDAFDASVWLQKASIDSGPTAHDVNGLIKLAGTVDGGGLKTLNGSIDIDSLDVAGRQVTRLTADLRKPGDRNVLQVSKIDARLAGGVVAGRVETVMDKSDPRFAVALQIRDAKIGELTGDAQAIEGRLTGSLQMEGRWDDATRRRGRGDAVVEGRDMYHVPVVFGFMQIANLSLPNDAPLRRAGLRYSIDGQKMTLEQIDLRSANSAMQGNGTIDFGTKQVQMTLSLADSPADAVPVFGPLFKSARQDLLQIKIRGTLQNPTVNAQAFSTFSTTVDEVMKGKSQ